MRENNKWGFTLVEMIVVLLIVAILAAMLVPTGLGFIDEKREEKCQLNRKNLLLYYKSDEIRRPNETLSDFIKDYKNETEDGRYRIECPSGGVYECRNEEIWCSVHDGGEAGFIPDVGENPDIGKEPDIDKEPVSGTVTITGAGMWEDIIKQYYGSENKTVPLGVYEDRNGNFIYVYYGWTPKSSTDTIEYWNDISHGVATKINTKYYLDNNNVDSYKYIHAGNGTSYPEKGTLYFDGQGWHICYNTYQDGSITRPPDSNCWKKIDFNIWNAQITPN